MIKAKKHESIEFKNNIIECKEGFSDKNYVYMQYKLDIVNISVVNLVYIFEVKLLTDCL